MRSRRIKLNTTDETQRDAAALVGAFIVGDLTAFEYMFDQIVADSADDTELAEQLANMFVNLCAYTHRAVIHLSNARGFPAETVHQLLTTVVDTLNVREIDGGAPER